MDSQNDPLACLRLHCASVRIGEHVVLFPGDSGAGKSTLHDLLTEAGHRPLGDDQAVCLLDRDGHWKLQRAYTTVEEKARGRVLPAPEPIRRLVFPDEHLPEGHRYLPCPPVLAARKLYRNSYPLIPNFDSAIRDAFQSSCRLARSIPANLLRFSLSSSFLPELLGLLESERSS